MADLLMWQKIVRKNGKNKPVILPLTKFTECIDEATDFAVKKAAILFIAYIMEDKSINCNEDRIAEVFEGISRYSQAIDDHLITLDKVSDIIQDLTGINIRWGKK